MSAFTDLVFAAATVDDVRIGRVKATIWRNETEDGKPHYNVVFARGRGRSHADAPSGGARPHVCGRGLRRDCARVDRPRCGSGARRPWLSTTGATRESSAARSTASRVTLSSSASIATAIWRIGLGRSPTFAKHCGFPEGPGRRRRPDLDRAPRPSTIATRTTATTARAEVNIISYYATLAGESPRFGGPFAPAGSALTAIGSAGESALRVSARGESHQLTRPRIVSQFTETLPGRETPHLTQSSPRTRSPASRPFRQSAKILTLPSRTWLPFSPLRQYTPEPHQLPLARHCSTMRRSAVLKRGRRRRYSQRRSRSMLTER